MVALSLLLLIPIASQRAALQAIPGPMAALVARGHHPWARRPDFGPYVAALSRFYARREGQPIWHAGSHLSGAGSAAIGQLRAAAERGLDPGDYDATLLDSLARASARAPFDAGLRAEFDLLLSIDLFRYLDDLNRGRLRPNPLGARGSAAVPLDLAEAVGRALEADSLPGLIAGVEPKLVQYRNLLQALTRYRRLAADSTLPDVAVTAPVRPGEGYPEVAALERRLIAFGDLTARVGRPHASARYAGPVVAAVRRFQTRHGLEPDGVLGPATFAALRVPLSWRVRQIELALERLRWLPPMEGSRIAVANIPAFELFAFDSAGKVGTPALEMKVIVGRALTRRTPLLFADMRYVEFWPYWNVPRSIVIGEILPELRRHPDYLRTNDMELIRNGTTPLGDRVTHEVLDGLAHGELRVRQRPGPTNPLWLIKFVFPNAEDVYLHGTPRTELFARTRRDFSHGCIRVENPVALANWLLRDEPAWPPDSVEAALRGQRTMRVPLARPLPVAIFYTTAIVRPDGSVWFYRDVYGQDDPLDRALRAPSEPPVESEPRASIAEPASAGLGF